MSEIKKILDEYGIINKANKILKTDEFKLGLFHTLSELEDNECHKNRDFPVSRLHRVKGIEQAIYRADIDKISGWRIHLQYDKKNNCLKLKDIIDGKRHDSVIKVIKSKKNRYE